jgi:hypothetical protein
VFTLSVAPEALQDLEGIWSISKIAAARIQALLEQIKVDQRLLDVLTVHDFGAYESAPFSVSKVQSQWNTGRDLWRLKLWDLEAQKLPYRVIYAYEIRRQRYHVLGVIHRKGFNYEPDHPFTRRILRSYNRICG